MRYKQLIENSEDRIFKKYLKKNKITINDLMQMSQDEINSMKNDAIKNKHLYPVPETDTEYYYHGTGKNKLNDIKASGLITQSKSKWDKNPLVGSYARNKIFLAPSVESAEFYANETSKTNPVILRILKSNITDIHPDQKETDGHVYTTNNIKPEFIQYWNGTMWKNIK